MGALGGACAMALALGACHPADAGARAQELASGLELTLVEDSASNPTVAVDARSGAAYVAWVGSEEGRGAVFLSVLEQAGTAPRKPVRVNDIPGDAAPHLQAPAQVAVGPEGNVYVLWQNNTPIDGRRFPASDLRLAVSRDGGRSFAPAVTVNDDAGGPPSSHTFHDIRVAADGAVLVSWIDSRARDAAEHQGHPAASPSGASHAMATMGEGAVPAQHAHGSAEGLPGPEIRVARSVDGGESFGASVVVDTGSCPCCRTALAVGPHGEAYVAWRKVFPGDVRDVVVARLDPGTLEVGEPVRVHEDRWVFPGCPHAGPSLAVAEDGTLLVGWYTGKEGRQGLWYAASHDGGRSFAAPAPVLTGDFVPPSQLRLATGEGRVWAAWDDRTGETPRVALAGAPLGEALRPVDAREAGGNPAIASAGTGGLVAWLDGESVRVRRLTVGSGAVDP